MQPAVSADQTKVDANISGGRILAGKASFYSAPVDSAAFDFERSFSWCVAALVAFHIFLLAFWLSLDSVPLITDSAAYYLQALNSSHRLRHQGIGSFATNVLTSGYLHPSLVPNLTSIILASTDFSQWIVLAIVNGMFLAALIVGTFLIGSASVSRTTGLVAAVLVSLAPSVYGLSRQFMLDLPAAALSTLFTAYFIRAIIAPSARRFIISGILAGLAVSAKEMAAIAVVAGLLMGGLQPGWKGSASCVKLMGLMVISATITASPFYALSLWGRIDEFLRHMRMGSEFLHQPDPLSVPSLLFYWDQLDLIFSPLVKWISLIGVILAFFDRRVRGCALATTVIYILFSLVSSKASRYILGILPFITVLTAWLLVEFGRRMQPARIALSSLVVGHLSLQYALLSFAPLPMFLQERFLPTSEQVAWKLIHENWYLKKLTGRQSLLDLSRRPLGPFWNIAQIAAFIASKEIGPSGIRIHSIDDYPFVTGPLPIELSLRDIQYSFSYGAYSPQSVKDADIIVYVPGWRTEERLQDNVQRDLLAFQSRHDCQKSFSVPLAVVGEAIVFECGGGNH